MELKIINYTNKFNSNKIKLECKYYNYTYQIIRLINQIKFD